MKIDYQNLEKKLKINFKNKDLLVKSLTHKSYDKINNNEKIEFLENIYSDEYLKTEKEKLNYIKKNIDQFKIIYSYLVKKNYYNDGAFHRSEKTILAKIFVKILLLFPTIGLNYKKLTSLKFREKNKNIITGI